MSLADRLRAASGAVVDALYAERVELASRVALPKRPYVLDDAFPPAIITARFVLDPKTEPFEGERRGSELSSFVTLAGEDALLVVRDSELADLGFRLKQGDRVRLLDPRRAALPAYAVAAIRRGGLGRRVIALTAEAA